MNGQAVWYGGKPDMWKGENKPESAGDTARNPDAEQQNPEQIKELANIPVKYLKMPGVADNEWQTVYLQVKVRKGAVCTFAYSLDGKKYTTVGESFTARQGKWIGAKVGLFCVTPNEGNRGWVDVDWFRMNK